MRPSHLEYNSYSNEEGTFYNGKQDSETGFMPKKFSIPFLFCVALLVFSEYYFLHEITGARRVGILALTIFGLFLSLFFFSQLYRSYHRSAK